MSDVLTVIGAITLTAGMAWVISHATVWCLSKWEDRR